jgi:mono/diheme cytochrome c family protein
MTTSHTSWSALIAAAVFATASFGSVAAVRFDAPPALSHGAEGQGGGTGQSGGGHYLFRTYCASCHGTSAMGDGPLAASMRRRPANLTEIAKRNGGVYPSEMVYRIIDGRQPVRGHGGPDMPVWGDAFLRTTEGGDEATVKLKIQALVTYLESLQVKLAF